jgi:D-arabinose 1-dehydrogenase-like Zn-dependent alcohol dehydrogenase
MIKLYECADVCAGSYFYTSYRKWHCQEGDIVVIVQVTRLCYTP